MRVFETTYSKYGTQEITVTIESSDPTETIVVYTLTVATVIPTHPPNNRTQTHLFDMVCGVPTWLTNRRVIPQDFIEENFINKIPEFDQTKTSVIRDMQTNDFLAAYRQPRRTSAEERYERRAAFGPGVPLVNVITGQRSRS